MSLPDPNAYVTEERLNEYHNIILPFLGGMPDILANKFARGDMYSTDEKMIGRWIDGKPLYQKTVDCGALPNATTKNVDPQISNIDKVVKCFGEAISGNNSDSFFLPYVTSNKTYDAEIDYIGGYIRLITGVNYSSLNAYATLQYTKTTDSPIEIGNDTDYSTTEKIIGTWIDGKPLYQKTVEFTTPNNGNWNTIEVLDSNCIIHFANGLVDDSFAIDTPSVSSATSSYAMAALNRDASFIKTYGSISYKSGDVSIQNKSAYITLAYTKTTD